MAAPVDFSRPITNISTAATTHNINVDSPAADVLLIVYVRFAAAPGTVTFTGYNLLTSDTTDATDDEARIYWRWADGTESTQDTLTTVNSVKGCAICTQVTGAANEAPTFSTVSLCTTAANTNNPSSVAPTGAPADTLYLALGSGDGEVGTYSAAPTNYVTITTANSGTGGAAATNCIMGRAVRQITASSSDDPPAFTHAAHTTGGSSWTVAVREPPVVAAAATRAQARYGF